VAVEHAQGAEHLGKGIIERDIETAVPDKSTELILYCGGGYRSALAADALQKMGYTNVWSMAAAGRPGKNQARRLKEGENRVRCGSSFRWIEPYNIPALPRAKFIAPSDPKI